MMNEYFASGNSFAGALYDARLGKRPRWPRAYPPRCFMRVPDEFLKCVAFISRREQRDGGEYFRFIGTGFFVSVPSRRQQDAHFHYFVTAKHVVDAILNHPFAVRVNATDGLTRNIWGDLHGASVKWWFHPTEEQSVDVAVALWDITLEEDIRTIPVEAFLSSKEEIDDCGIGPGDQVFFPGCFTLLTGQERNYRLVRTGNIAMMPGEPIPHVKVGNSGSAEVEGYLIEARSIGGLSGSPVFVRETVSATAKVINTKTNKEMEKNIAVLGEPHLLGLAQGHWNVKPEDKNSVIIRPDSDSLHRVNLGISIVVPASKILEVINHQELIEIINRSEEQWVREQGTSEPDGTLNVSP
jgi:hypothetical protein